jgi:GMP synthase (glutamine-hydrolysing)
MGKHVMKVSPPVRGGLMSIACLGPGHLEEDYITGRAALGVERACRTRLPTQTMTVQRPAVGRCGMRVLVIQNCEAETVGLYEAHLRDRGIPYRVHHAYRGGDFPSVGDFDAFIMGGTPLSANSVDEHAFLGREWRFIKELVRADAPYLGICFGAQLLARALGAEVRRCPAMEIGGYEVELTEDGRASPLLKGFPDRFPVFHWHGDAFDVPQAARLLATGEGCPNQAFSRGRALGVQFHLEVTAAEAARWADAYAPELATVGRTRERVVDECRERESAMAALAGALLDNLLDSID